MAMLTNQRVLLVPRILLCKGRDSDALDRETHRGERSEQVTRNGRGGRVAVEISLRPIG